MSDQSRATADFVAIDLGAASGRVLLGRWDGERFDLSELHRFENGPVHVLGRMHWDVLRLWAEIKGGLARYASAHGARPDGIGVDSWAVDFGLLDRSGALLGNPRHYRDRRTEGMVERVAAIVPPETIFTRTGIQFMRINTLYQLYAMAAERDPQLEAAQTFLMIPDLLHYWLTGRAAGEYTNATSTQCFDCRQNSWATDMLTQLGIPTALLPEVVLPGTTLGGLLPELAAEVGLAAATPVIVPGTHDTASAVAAVPGLDSDSAYISSGTWSLVGIETDVPVTSAQALAFNVTNEGGVGGTIRLLKNVAGLWLLQECRRRWQAEGRAAGWGELLAAAERARPLATLIDPDDEVFLSPDDMPAAIDGYCHGSGQQPPADVGAYVRCCLESLALGYRRVIEALEQLSGRRITTIRVVGGGSQNQLLCQLTADACGRVVVAGPVEATALGNIMVQAIAAGRLGSIAEGRAAVAASFPHRRYEPQTGEWDAAYARFRGLGS